MSASNPFYHSESNEELKVGWYYYDETFDSIGPYETEEEAQEALNKYVAWLNKPMECP